jgi:hypothetical protein
VSSASTPSGLITWPEPSRRGLAALHVASVLPLVALAVWFGLIDRLPFGAGRCASCGVEGYVIAAHVAAAAWLAAVVACAAATRRRVAEGIAAPGPANVVALAAFGLLVVAGVVWHPLLNLPVLAAMIASIVLFPAAVVWWVVGALMLRRPPRTDAELRSRVDGALASAWVSLALLLPALFGWVWADRVDWLVF